MLYFYIFLAVSDFIQHESTRNRDWSIENCFPALRYSPKVQLGSTFSGWWLHFSEKYESHLGSLSQILIIRLKIIRHLKTPTRCSSTWTRKNTATSPATSTATPEAFLWLHLLPKVLQGRCSFVFGLQFASEQFTLESNWGAKFA